MGLKEDPKTAANKKKDRNFLGTDTSGRREKNGKKNMKTWKELKIFSNQKVDRGRGERQTGN